MKAYLKNYRMSPRKVRLVGDAVKGKNVAKADIELSFMPKKAARTIQTLIRSALQNAVNNNGMKTEDLIVKSVEVNQGVTLKRYRPRARGSASAINKRTSNISVILEEKKLAVKEVSSSKTETKKTEKSPKITKKPSTKTKKVEISTSTSETK